MAKFDPAPTLAAGIIRLARQQSDLTQAELAATAGMSQQVISAYETGRREPTIPSLLRVVRAANLDLRFRLVALDRHDEGLAQYMEALPPTLRADLEDAEGRRVREARLRSVRNK